MKLLSASLILTLSFSALAQKKPRVQDELARHRSEVMSMGARLSTLEKEISQKSNLYQSNLEEIKKFENDVGLYKEELKTLQRKLIKTEKDNKKIVTNYLLEAESEESPLWQKKIHPEDLDRVLASQEIVLNFNSPIYIDKNLVIQDIENLQNKLK